MGKGFQHALVVVRQHAHNLGQNFVPIFKHTLGQFAAGVLDVLLDHAFNHDHFLIVIERFAAHHIFVYLLAEAAIPIDNIRRATRHARRKVAPGLAQHDHAPSGHVFAAVVAHAFHNRIGP